MSADQPPETKCRILSRPDGSSIAYHKLDGAGPSARPGVVFIHGFMSDMNGGKALHLEAHCRATGRAFVRFDTLGHGQSSGRFEDGTIGRWAEDTIAILDEVTEGPQILVGSSMGGWLMLLAALARPDKVKGLLGIAPAPDFTEDLTWPEMTDAQREEVLSRGFTQVPSDYDDSGYIFTKDLFEDGRRHLLLRNDTLPFHGPVRILHGLKDDAVPWQRSLTLMNKLASDDVEVTFIKNGDHRLSEPHDLDRLTATLDALAARLETVAA